MKLCYNKSIEKGNKKLIKRMVQKKMEYLSREDVAKKFNEFIAKYGKPKNGMIFCESQLISEIVKNLSICNETHIIYEYSKFEVISSIIVKDSYSDDCEFIGTVNAKEWFTNEQLKALHELAFGYQF